MLSSEAHITTNVRLYVKFRGKRNFYPLIAIEVWLFLSYITKYFVKILSDGLSVRLQKAKENLYFPIERIYCQIKFLISNYFFPYFLMDLSLNFITHFLKISQKHIFPFVSIFFFFSTLRHFLSFNLHFFSYDGRVSYLVFSNNPYCP